MDQVPIAEARNPGGEYLYDFESAQSAVDGRTDTKWLDTQFCPAPRASCVGESVMQILLIAPAHVVEYELWTGAGEDCP